MERIHARLLAGAAAGVLATGAHTLVMWTAKRAGLLGELPPRKITRALLGPFRSRRALDAQTALAHVGFGLALGAAFALLPRRWRSPATGTAFGTLVWATSYVGWVPRLGVMPKPTWDRPGRPTAMVLAHVAFGLVLGGALRRWPALPARAEPPTSAPA